MISCSATGPDRHPGVAAHLQDRTQRSFRRPPDLHPHAEAGHQQDRRARRQRRLRQGRQGAAGQERGRLRHHHRRRGRVRQERHRRPPAWPGAGQPGDQAVVNWSIVPAQASSPRTSARPAGTCPCSRATVSLTSSTPKQPGSRPRASSSRPAACSWPTPCRPGRSAFPDQVP